MKKLNGIKLLLLAVLKSVRESPFYARWENLILCISFYLIVLLYPFFSGNKIKIDYMEYAKNVSTLFICIAIIYIVLSQFVYWEGSNERDSRIKQEQERRSNLAKEGIIECPKCHSTTVTAGTRGYTVTTGFIGSGNHRNVCMNCGCKWKPKAY